MTRWDLEQNSTGFRVEFRFENEVGALVRNKTWELRRERSSPAKALLLQAHGTLLSEKATMEEVRAGYVRITTKVSEINGDLGATAFDGFHDPDKINKQIASFPITIGVVLDSTGLHFTLHSSTKK